VNSLIAEYRAEVLLTPFFCSKSETLLLSVVIDSYCFFPSWLAEMITAVGSLNCHCF